MNEFPHTITFEIESEVSDGSGGFITDWVTFKQAEAHVVPISGDILFLSQQNQTNITYKVFIEFDPEINNNLRIKLSETEFLTIKASIDQGGLNEILVLMCEGGL